MQLDKEFYTIEELAQILRVDAVTIRRKIKEQKIETIKVGLQYRIPRSEVQRILNEGL